MKTILFILPRAQGHLNGSVKVSKPLLDQGYNVIYANDVKYEKWILSNGFRFYPISDVFNTNAIQKKSKSPLDTFFTNFLDCLTKEQFNKFLSNSNEITALIRTHKPDVLILDSFWGDAYMPFIGSEMMCIQLENFVLPERTVGIPPLNSKMVPTFDIFSNFKSWFLWKFLFLRKSINIFIQSILTFGQNKEALWKQTAKHFNASYSTIFNSNTAFYNRIIGIPCIVTSPKYFDFPRQTPKDVYYMNNFMTPKAVNSGLEDPLWAALKSIKTHNAEKEIIYCSLGTLSEIHLKNHENFFKKMVKVAEVNKNYHIVISMGKNAEKIKQLPNNVLIFDYVNQVQVLKYADMMINHGGINSISECIFAEVPMLVYPLNSKWDQNGNSARVQFHEIGLTGNINKDSEKVIAKKISLVLESMDFRANIKKMKEKIILDGKSNPIHEMIKKM